MSWGGEIDKDLLWKSITKQESGGKQFNRDGSTVTSKAGAIGISQLMPETAKATALKHGLPWDLDRLKNDPSYNETIGRLHFGDLMKDYGGDTQKALAGYNWGKTRLNKHIAKYGDSWFDKLPDNHETKKYIPSILSGYSRRKTAALIPSYGEEVDGGLPNIYRPDEEVDTEVIADQKSRGVFDETEAAYMDEVGKSIEQSNPVAQRAPKDGQPEAPQLPQATDLVTTGFKEAVPPPVPVSEYTTPDYERRGATQSGVRNNKGWLGSLGDKIYNEAQDGTMGSVLQIYERWDAQRRNEEYHVAKLTPDEANKKYPGLPDGGFKESVHPGVAQIIYDNYTRRKADVMWDERGSALGWGGNVIAGIGVFGGDPLNLVMGAGTGKLLSKAGLEIAGKTGLEKLGSVMLENVVTGAEARAIEAINRKQNLDPMSSGEFIEGTVSDAVFGSLIHYGIGAMRGGLQSIREELGKESPGAIKKNIGRWFKKVEVEGEASAASIAKATARVRIANEAGLTPDGVEQHVYSPQSSDLSGRPYYSSHTERGEQYRFGDDVGLVTVVDNPNAARNTGVSVKEIRLSEETKLAKFEQKLSEIVGVAEKLDGLGIKVKVTPDTTVGDLVRMVKQSENSGRSPEGSLQRVHDLFRSEGFHGYTDIQTLDGRPIHNRVMLFSEDGIEQQGEFRPVDQEKAYREPVDMEPQDVTPEEQASQTKEGLKHPETDGPGIFIEPESGLPKETQKMAQEYRAALDEAAKIDPEIGKLLKDIDGNYKLEKSAEKIIRALTNCGATKFV